MNKIAVGIVLYNPKLERLKLCIESVLKQADKVYLFDNSNTPTNLKFNKKIIYKCAKKNFGIAYALNYIMRIAKNDGYNWVITMDQDSIMPYGILNAYKNYINFKNVAIICPQVIDKRRVYMKIKTTPNIEYLKKCITSASCTSIEAWEKVGGFDEWLFIDLVDNEFCKRLEVSGYKILRINKWILDQEFGQIIPKDKKTQKFYINLSKIFHNENFAKFSYKKFVNPIRVYYTNRNIIYVNKKLKKYGKIGYENYNCKNYFGFLISFSLPSFLRAQNKIKVLKAIFKGIWDGINKDVVPWNINSL